MKETELTKTLEEILKETTTYEFVKKEEIDELNSTGYLLYHKKTGAKKIPFLV